MENREGIFYKLRVVTVHAIYVIYTTLLWLKLVDLGEQTGHPRDETEVALIVWTVCFVLCQGGIAFSALSGSPYKVLQQTWMNFPMLLFVVLSLPPYGFTLKHMYEVAEIQAKENFSGHKNSNCTVQLLHVPMPEFILLQMVMPVLLVTFVIYPLPRKAYTSSEYLAIAVEFINAFDIMDMVGDFQFVKHYGTAWEVVYYVSLGTSVVLVAFPIKIENEDITWQQMIAVCSHSQVDISNASMTSMLDAPIVFETDSSIKRVHTSNSCSGINMTTREDRNMDKNISNRTSSLQNLSQSKDTSIASIPNAVSCSKTVNDQDNKTSLSVEIKKKSLHENDPAETRKMYRKIVKVVLTLLFTDIMFSAIRFRIMVKEQSADYGFNMFAKNVILACLHISYLLQHLKRLIVAKLSRNIQS